MIDFELCDLRGRSIAPLLELAGGQVTVAISDRRTAQTPVSFEDPGAAVARPLSTVLKARWEGAQLFTGVVLRPRFAGAQRQVTVPATDPGIRLTAAFVGGRGDGTGLAGAIAGNPWRWEGLDQSEMVARLMEHASPTAAELAAGVPDHGIIRGQLAAASVARDREYEQGKQILEAISEFAHLIDGVDYELEPLDRQDGVLAQLNTYYPQQGADRTGAVRLEYGWGQANASDFSWEPAGDVVRNRSIRVGQVDAGGSQLRSMRNRDAAQLELGLYSEFVGESDVVDQATLDQHADAAIAAYGWPVDYFTVTPATDEGAGWRRNAAGALQLLPGRYGTPPVFHPNGAYWLGDVIEVVARDRPGLDVELVGRVMTATLTNTQGGGVVAELGCAPIVGGGYRARGSAPPTFIDEFSVMRERLRMLTITQ